VLREGQPVPLAVVPGLDDESFTEIVQGDLRPGEQVIIGEASGTTAASSASP
jgi:HlyD family secretion protein